MAEATLIKGYRNLTEAEITLINSVKNAGLEIETILVVLAGLDSTDKRWLAIGRTHLQQGFMAVVRAIAKPEGF